MDKNFLESIKKTFLSESKELIAQIEADLLAIEQDFSQDELINNILRNVHTLKGSSGVIGVKELTDYIHKYEDVVKNFIEKDERPDDAITLLLNYLDYIDSLIDTLIVNNEEINIAEFNKSIIELNEILNVKKKNEDSVDSAFGFFDVKEDGDKKSKTEAEKTFYRISIKFKEKRHPGTWFPEQLIDDIEKKGKIINIAAKISEEITWTNVDFIQCYFSWIFVVESNEPFGAIDDVFLFFKLNNEINIETLDEASLSLVGEILVSDGKISKHDLEEALSSREKLGDFLIQQNKLTEEDLNSALEKQKKVRTDIHTKDELKISTKKVDLLIDLVGELIVANSNLNNIQQELQNLDIEQIYYNINKISRQMRDAILSLKMVPIGQLLIRFYRIIRDLSKEFGKKVNFVIEGENTEVDKTMFSILQEPLLHIIRNSLDHGIETTSERKKAGKNESGKLIIRAYQESGQIVFEIEDDGRGLDKNKILKKAIDKNILQSGKKYTEEEIYNVIFQPGFSTKDKATHVSGRGIGMDVVMEGIKKINGSIRILSNPGIGTKIIIQLPLTLAIIEGFLTRIGKNHFVIPIQYISECFEITEEELIDNKGAYNLRGEYLTIISLDRLFNNIAYDTKQDGNKKVVVLIQNQEKLGFVVDDIIGDIQAVIKPLLKIVNKSQILTGSAVLGDGGVALIIDVLHLFSVLNILQNK